MTFAPPADTQQSEAEYESSVLSAIEAKNFSHRFSRVSSAIAGHSAVFLMSSDALQIEGVRWGMGARLTQQVADLLGCMLPTARLRDLLYAQRAVTLFPITVGTLGLGIDALTRTSTMRSYSSRIDRELVKAGYRGGIVQTTGKPWILTNELATHAGKSCNYGWHLPPGTSSPWLGVPIYPAATDPSFSVIQQPGFAHGLDQSDYSETPTLVHRACVVDGQAKDLVDVLSDPELAPLASSEGVLSVLRQPGVAPFACNTGASTTALLMSDAASPGQAMCQAPPPPDPGQEAPPPPAAVYAPQAGADWRPGVGAGMGLLGVLSAAWGLLGGGWIPLLGGAALTGAGVAVGASSTGSGDASPGAAPTPLPEAGLGHVGSTLGPRQRLPTALEGAPPPARLLTWADRGATLRLRPFERVLVRLPGRGWAFWWEGSRSLVAVALRERPDLVELELALLGGQGTFVGVNGARRFAIGLSTA
jgi:hypothetical protein